MAFLIGITILGLIFGAIYAAMIRDLGFLGATSIWIMTIATTALIYLAIYLITLV